jgi:hypothetical protein
MHQICVWQHVKLRKEKALVMDGEVALYGKGVKERRERGLMM